MMNKLERFIQENNELLAKNYKFCKENKLDHIIDDKLLKAVAEGGYVNDNGTFDGIEEGYKPYYEYLKYGNQYQEEEKGGRINMTLLELYKDYQNKIAKKFVNGEAIDRDGFEALVDAGLMINPNYNKMDYEDYIYNKYQQIESQNYNYETPYSFEYEPYMIEFNHEVDYNEPIQQEEVIYEDNDIEEENVDINVLINIVDILSNKISKVKKTIIHYISNYRPMYNQYTHNIDVILIE